MITLRFIIYVSFIVLVYVPLALILCFSLTVLAFMYIMLVARLAVCKGSVGEMAFWEPCLSIWLRQMV